MSKEGARKTKEAMVVSLVPDICMTPCGPSMVPVPYQVVGSFKDSVDVSKDVFFGGEPAFLCGQSYISKTTGAEPGTGGGIMSGTTGGKAEPILGSSTVKVNGKPIVRHGDLFKMNNGNTIGRVVYQLGAVPACSISVQGKPTGNTNPPPKPETEKEKGFLNDLEEWFKKGLKNIPAALNDPVQGAIGALKDIGNAGLGVADLVVRGTMMNQAGQMGMSAGLPGLMGDDAQAKENAQVAENFQKEAQKTQVPQMEMSNPAQEGGAFISQMAQVVIGVAGLVEGGFELAGKGMAKLGGKEAALEGKATAATLKGEANATKLATEEAEVAPKSGGDGVSVSPNKKNGVRKAIKFLKENGVPKDQRKEILSNFETDTINVRNAGQDEYGIRYYDDEKAKPKGKYLFETFPASRDNLAVDPEWNKMTKIKQWQIRPDSTLIEGRAASQGGNLTGGQLQKFIINPDNLMEP